MDDRYAKLRAAQQSIGVSDWQWWDSNSFRRLTFIEANGRHGQDGGALCAVVQPSDGHPDVQMASGVREFIEACSPDTIRALLADYDRMREALTKLRRGFVAARGNAEAMFRESGSIYHEGRRVAYDQALTDVREALAQEES